MNSPSDDELAVRLPRQQRSRQAWARILDAGVAIMEDVGYDAFTIAEVCERAEVAPRAVYERVNTKDGLFLAVYEHKMQQVLADQSAAFHETVWEGMTPQQLIRGAIEGMVTVFTVHRAFLSSVILISGVHREVYRRGSLHARNLGDQFTAILMRGEVEIRHANPEAAIRMTFTSAFSSIVLRTSYGPGFFGPAVDDATFVSQLSDMADSYLLRYEDH
ncbi:helix-turn-helix domain-containing protein [Rhodococcus sovatensis]|uniref:Helix-turn-helix domain-containing protein n=1 Tax=Rhodococcus sovatensis TaxID=1805840 RepID=A0ABZ2PSB2_9NOCA